jgi:hypothetical protein
MLNFFKLFYLIPMKIMVLKNASMGNLDYEIVHVDRFSHFQKDHVVGNVSFHYLENQNDRFQTKLPQLNEIESELFDEQEDSLDNTSVIFDNVKECLDIFIDRPVVSIFFEDDLKHNKIE